MIYTINIYADDDNVPMAGGDQLFVDFQEACDEARETAAVYPTCTVRVQHAVSGRILYGYNVPEPGDDTEASIAVYGDLNW